MTNDITKDQLKALQDSLDKQESVPIGCQMNHFGFEFLIEHLGLFDTEKYKADQNIQIVSEKSIPGRYQCRLIFSDNSSKMINLREEK